MYKISEIEKLVAQDSFMPSDLKPYEQLAFIMLRSLYRDYNKGKIPKELAKAEKEKILSEYEKYKTQYQFDIAFSKRMNKTSALRIRIEKEGCELCRKLVRTLDGRE